MALAASMAQMWLGFLSVLKASICAVHRGASLELLTGARPTTRPTSENQWLLQGGYLLRLPLLPKPQLPVVIRNLLFAQRSLGRLVHLSPPAAFQKQQGQQLFAQRSSGRLVHLSPPAAFQKQQGQQLFAQRSLGRLARLSPPVAFQKQQAQQC